MHDLRYALRFVRLNPGFSLTAILTLGLGIGATTAVYSVYDAVLLKPLPFVNPERVVAMRIRVEGGGPDGISGGTFAAARKLPAIEHAAVFMGSERTFLDRSDPEIVRGAAVTGEFFGVFGVVPSLGRVFEPADETSDVKPLVLSERLWRRRFNSDPAIAGRPVRLDDTIYTVAGVMPHTFRMPEDAEFWLPYRITSAELAREGTGPFRAVARVRPGDLAAASAQADVLSGTLPPREGKRQAIALDSLRETDVFLYRSTLRMLLGAVLTVLLIACANVANLLLARTSTRVQELAIRRAVGATGLRLLGQLLTESAILAGAAGLAGLTVAWWLIRLLPALGSLDIPRIDDAALDVRVLGFTAGIVTASLALFGLAPAWVFARRGPSLAGERSSTPRGLRHTSRVLIALEIAVTVTLLVGSAMTLTSLHRLLNVDLGFDSDHLTVAAVRPSLSKYAGAERWRFYERILDRLNAAPGVESVSAMSHVPLARVLADAASVITEEGVAMREGRSGPRRRILAPGALRTLGVPLVSGREFMTADQEGGPRVAIVNEALAQSLWPGRDPLGQRLSIASAGDKQSYLVVGLARNLRGSLVRAPQPEVYVSATQVTARELSLVVRSVLPAASVVAAIRAAIQSEEPDQPIAGVATVSSLAREATTYRRFNTALLTLFGLFAALLAAAGILAVVSYAVARRTREIGVRMALGASPHRVVLLVMRDVSPAIGVGLVVGLLAIYNLSFLLARAGLLFEVREFDLPAYAAATAVVMMLGGFAAWLPARRAAHVDPVVALRE